MSSMLLLKGENTHPYTIHNTQKPDHHATCVDCTNVWTESPDVLLENLCLNYANLVNLAVFASVSYTHLDVYKRQI